jgi:hypothetical protein
MTPDDHPSSRLDQAMADKTFLVVGVVRNCARHLRPDVMKLKLALTQNRKLFWLLIESDSTDATLAALEALKNEEPTFNYISLGSLKEDMPLRTVRLAHCRNVYVDQIRTNEEYKDVDYVVVADFDGLNTLISKASIASCFVRDDWDVCTANQRAPYYDIWALRHQDWCANDCWAEYRYLRKFISSDRVAKYVSIFSKMLLIPPESKWIEVDSAFGGLAIYRKRLFSVGIYSGLTHENAPVCEHVAFNKALRAKGYRIYINPKLINAEYTEHSEPLRNGRAWQPDIVTTREVMDLTRLLAKHPELAAEIARLAALAQERP